jgi:hypothetical protein
LPRSLNLSGYIFSVIYGISHGQEPFWATRRRKLRLKEDGDGRGTTEVRSGLQGGRGTAGPGDGKPIAQVARELGVNEGTLGNWVNLDRRRRGAGNGQLSEDERAELARLHRECGCGVMS